MKLIIDAPDEIVKKGFEGPLTDEERQILIRAIGNGTLYKDEWIPVSERLPKEDNDYLVTYVSSGERVVSKSWFNTRNGFIYDNVIAWKYKPEPYKEGGAE